MSKSKTTVSRAEYLQLEGLAALARRHSEFLMECEAAMDEILGLPRRSGECSDVIYGDRDIRWLLEHLYMRVAEPVLEPVTASNQLEEEFFEIEGRPAQPVGEGQR